MQYNININQKALAQSGLDFSDAAILDFLYHFERVRTKAKIYTDEKGRDYRWINYKHIIAELPMLKIKDKAAISRRLVNIEQTGYIKLYRSQDNTMYYCITDKYSSVIFNKDDTTDSVPDTPPIGSSPRPVDETQQAVDETQQPPVDETQQHNHSTNIKHITSNHSAGKPAEPVGEVVTIEKQIAEVIKSFEPVNSHVPRLYGNMTERKAARDLIETHGFDRVLKAVSYACTVFGRSYAPVITTPYELVTKYDKLRAYVMQEKHKQSSSAVSFM